MSLFSASHGHTYYKPLQPSTRQALSGNAPPSREGSVALESQGSAYEKGAAASSQTQEDSTGGVKTAWEALRMTINHGKEYSDDMQLVGEPGNFRFSKNKDSAATASQAKISTQASFTSVGTPGSRAASVAAPTSSSPSKVEMTGDKATAGSEGPSKTKRRKSRVDGASP